MSASGASSRNASTASPMASWNASSAIQEQAENDCIISNVRTHRSSEITTPLKPKCVHRSKRNPHAVRAKFAIQGNNLNVQHNYSISVNNINYDYVVCRVIKYERCVYQNGAYGVSHFMTVILHLMLKK